MAEEYLNVNDFASLHNLRPSTVYNWIYRDKVKHINQYGVLLILKDQPLPDTTCGRKGRKKKEEMK